MVVLATDTGCAVRVLFPEAREVYAVGGFNNYSTVDTPLVYLGGGVWEARLPMNVDVRGLCFFVRDRGRMFGHLQRTEAETSQPVAAQIVGQAS